MDKPPVDTKSQKKRKRKNKAAQEMTTSASETLNLDESQGQKGMTKDLEFFDDFLKVSKKAKRVVQ